jgi:transposase
VWSRDLLLEYEVYLFRAVRRELAIAAMGAEAVIPPKKNRTDKREYHKDQYKERHLIECFFGKLKHFRRVFSRFEQLARNFLAFIHLACSLIWLR